MTLLRHVWGHMYSNDQEVVSYYAKMLPVLGISFFVDGLHASLSGQACLQAVASKRSVQPSGAKPEELSIGVSPFGGRGHPLLSALNYPAFTRIHRGIPMALLLGFVFHMKGMGLWLGMMCGSIAKVLLFASVALFIDWNKEAVKAKERVFGSSLLVT